MNELSDIMYSVIVPCAGDVIREALLNILMLPLLGSTVIIATVSAAWLKSGAVPAVIAALVPASLFIKLS